MMGLAEGLGRMMGGIQGPLMGYCTDRFGPRVMLAFGGLMSGVGFILLGYTGSFWYFLIIFVGFLSVGFRSGYNNASIAAVNNWFSRRRGLAMSVVSMGNGLGGASAPLVGLLIFTVGWRDACTVLGVAILAVVIPLSWFLRRSPEEMGLLPDGDRPETAADTANTTAAADTAHRPTPRRRRRMQFGATDFTAKEAMRTPSYWLLVMATGFRNIVHAGASFLMAPLIVWFLQGGGAGADADGRHTIIAAVFVGAFSLANMVFNPAMGWLGDKVDRRKLSALCMVSGALALASPAHPERAALAAGAIRRPAGFRRKRQPPQLGHYGRLLWPPRLRHPARLAAPPRPAGLNVDGNVDGRHLRLHRQLLLGIVPPGRPLCGRRRRLLVPALPPPASAPASPARARGGPRRGRPPHRRRYPRRRRHSCRRRRPRRLTPRYAARSVNRSANPQCQSASPPGASGCGASRARGRGRRGNPRAGNSGSTPK